MMALRLVVLLFLAVLLVQTCAQHEIIDPDKSEEVDDIILTPEQMAALNLTAGGRAERDTQAKGNQQIIIDPDHIDEGSDIMLTANQSAALNLTERDLQDVKILEIDDIMLTSDQAASILNRKAVSSIAQHWTDVNGFPHVPYTFEDDVVDRVAVEAAIQHWRDHTCITFTQVANTQTGPRLKFVRHASACNSYVGMINRLEGQTINVPVWCEQAFGSLVHEVGHAMGFWHEQSRSDRDNYVTIVTQNIRSAAVGNFDLRVDNPWGVPYDYYSDMHYSGTGFTKNSFNTIVTKDPRFQNIIGQRTGLSHMDKLLANTMYGCTDKLLATCGLASDPCQNYGYLGKECDCVCPQGTSGSNCESLDTPFDEVNLSPNTEIITSPTTISTVDYPNNFPTNSDFVKWIKAPACKLIKITFTDFKLYGETTKTVDGVSVTGCWHDSLEIRMSNMVEGDWYCGTSIASGTEFTSTGNEAVIYFRARTNFNKGFSADVTFEQSSSCTTTSTTSTSTTSTSTTSTSTSTSTTSTSTTSTSTSTSTTSTSTSTSTTSTSTSTTSTSTSTTSTSTSTTSTSTTSTSTSTTSTSTTSTSTTSTSTSTSTTSTSTTTTSTSTSTTSTSTSTTTTTTSTSTTTSPSTPSWAPCELSTDGAFINLASPNFPLVYPNDAMCMLSNLTDELGLFLIDIKMLRLGPGEVLQIENPYTKPRMLMGYMPRKTIVIPSAQFRATFTSDSERRWRGFRLVARVDSNTGCHQKLSATNGGVITSPGFPSRHPWRTYCEWHITASEGKKVRLVFTLMKIRFFNYLAVNPTSDPYYSPGSVIYLRGRRLPAPVESNSNLIRIFFAGRFPTKGFRLEYSEV